MPAPRLEAHCSQMAAVTLRTGMETEMRQQLAHAGLAAVRRGRLELRDDSRKPALGDLCKCEITPGFRVVEPSDFFAKLSERPLGEFPVRRLERTTILLARSFHQTIVNAR